MAPSNETAGTRDTDTSAPDAHGIQDSRTPHQATCRSTVKQVTQQRLHGKGDTPHPSGTPIRKKWQGKAARCKSIRAM